MAKEEFKGNLSEYERQFALNNPELCLKYPDYKQKLPPNCPIFLLSQPSFNQITGAEAVKELLKFSLGEREVLRMMQDNNYDIPMQLAMVDIMEELQTYASGFRKWLKVPLVVTPWTEINVSLTDKSVFKILGEAAKFSAKYVSGSPRFYALDSLYEDMMARDVLNRQLHMLKNQKGSELLGFKRDLEKQIKELTARIKKELPKRFSSIKSKYLVRGLTEDEIRKLRPNCQSVKGARSGKPLTTNLDVLNKSGLARLRILIKGLKTLGKVVNKGSTWLNYGAVAYDTAEAYRAGNKGAAARTLITGSASVYLTTQIVASIGGTGALGGLVIGTLAGDLTLGGMVLLSSPFWGWCLVIVRDRRGRLYWI